MKDTLLQSVKKFLEAKKVASRTVVLGCSGGPDSKALLYLLQECRRFFPFEICVAHIDHGWRAESGAQAEELRKEVEQLGLPFFCRVLSKGDFQAGNLEEQGRSHRLNFFKEIYLQHGCQGLVLGHHADDQAEVVLKRLFEGASLFSLGGLSGEANIHGMHLWRPLLHVEKKKVLAWLQQRGIAYFQDPSNDTAANLRGKMRTLILPSLAASFGKEIASNLCRLGEESKEIKEHFTRLNHPYLPLFQRTDVGTEAHFHAVLPLPPLQVKFLFREWLAREKLVVSHEILEGIVETLLEREGRRQFKTAQGEFSVNQMCFTFKKSLI